MPATGTIKSQPVLESDINAVIKNNPAVLIRGDVLAQILADIEKSSINNLTDYSANSSIIFKNSAGFITNLAVPFSTIIGRDSSGEITTLPLGSGLSIVGGALTVSGVSGDITVGTTNIFNGTIGAVPYHGGSDKYQEEPTQLFWNIAQSQLGVGTDLPAAKLHAKGATNGTTAYTFKADNLGGGSLLWLRNDGAWALGLNASASIANQTELDVNINGILGSGGSGYGRIAIGAGSADAPYSIAIGSTSVGTAGGALALGAFSNVTGSYGVAVGFSMSATATGSIIIGSDFNAAITNAIPRSFMLGLGGNSGVLHKQSLFVNYKTNVVLRSEDTITTATHYDAYATNTLTVHNGLAGTVTTITSVTAGVGSVAVFNFASNITLLAGDPVSGSGFAVYTGLNTGTWYIGSANITNTTIQLYPTRADALANTNGVVFVSNDTGTITPLPRNPTTNITGAFQLYSVAGQAWILPGTGAAFQIGSGGGGGDALTSNPLSQFAATTSLQLKGVISDETGSGALVFATAPTFSGTVTFGTTPVLAVASGGVINFDAGDVTITHSANLLAFASASNGYSFDAIVKPATNDGAPLGSTTLMWSDLFLASGAVINFNNGDITITHSSNQLTFSGAASGYSFDTLIRPAANDGTALGSGSLAFADLFLASGGIINWNNGDVLITHSANLLAFSGATSGYTFDVAIGVASGGTGKSSVAQDRFIYASAANVYSEAITLDVAEQTIASAIAFTAGTDPNTPTNITYRWHQNRTLVTARFNLLYTNAGVTVTQVRIAKPADMPNPVAPSGFTGSLAVANFGSGMANTGVSGIGTNNRAVVRRNTADTAWEFVVDCPSGSHKAFWIDISYFA